MTRIKFRHIVIAVLGGVGLYFAAIALAFFVGLVAGFITYARPVKPIEVVRYVSHPAQSVEPRSGSASRSAQAE